jgi:hypothetical protein
MLDSRILVDTAENTECGQGLTINHFVGTEYARWPHDPKETLANIRGGVSKDGTQDIESTPNGLGGPFYEEVIRTQNDPANSPYKLFFFEWWWEPDYRISPAKVKEKDLDEEERDLIHQFHLDLEQITWRRNMIAFDAREFNEKFPESLVRCFISSGTKFFNETICYKRYQELNDFKPFTTNENKTIVVFHKRIKGRNYIIGCDTAKGIQVSSTDTDYSAAKVIDEETGEEMARFHDRLPPEEFGVILAELGRLYNDALIGVERDGYGYSVLLALNGENYGNIYRHRAWEDRFKQTVIEIPGWPNNMVTRPIAVNRLAQYIREAPENIYDQMMLQECLTFSRDPKTGRPQALESCHDDTVFAGAIAQYIRLVRLGFIDALGENRESYGQTGF